MTSTFMTFVATVAFFAIAGPVAIAFGAGHALEKFGLPLGITLYGSSRRASASSRCWAC